MIKSFIFLLIYKILKDPINLSCHPKEFFQLSKNTQRKVLDKYFTKLDKTFPVDNYFNTKESRYYQNNEEVSFYNCYYFDKLVIELNPNNLPVSLSFVCVANACISDAVEIFPPLIITNTYYSRK